MFQDCRGLSLTTVSPRAAAAYDHVIDAYLGYRADLGGRLDTMLAADPDFGLAHSLKGCTFMMAFRADRLGLARSELAEARRGAAWLGLLKQDR